MGCDIHIYAEKRVDGKWQHVGGVDEYKDLAEFEPLEGRWYAMFAVLANVRNSWDIKPISEPKGLPADVSDEIRDISDDWETDGHSHSWVTAREFNEYDWQDMYRTNRFVNFNEAVEEAKQGLKQISENPDDVRLVFWFDN